MLLQPGGAARVVFLHRLGINAAEIWIVLRIEGCHLAGGSREQIDKTTGSHAEESVVRKAQFGAGDPFEIDQLLDGLIIHWTNICRVQSIAISRNRLDG